MCVGIMFAVLIHIPSFTFFSTKISLTVLDLLQCYLHFFYSEQAETRISSISQKNVVI